MAKKNETEEITLDQALQNIENLCGAYRGTIQEHQVIQASLMKIKAELAKK